MREKFSKLYFFPLLSKLPNKFLTWTTFFHLHKVYEFLLSKFDSAKVFDRWSIVWRCHGNHNIFRNITFQLTSIKLKIWYCPRGIRHKHQFEIRTYLYGQNIELSYTAIALVHARCWNKNRYIRFENETRISVYVIKLWIRVTPIIQRCID